MPTLITLPDVQDAFPAWAQYLKLSTETPGELETRLSTEIDNAETKLREYLPALSPAAFTPALRLHLLVLVRKFVFDVRHGNTAFDSKPQVVRDYEDTLKMLERYRTGEFGAPLVDGEAPRFTLTAKPRRFGGAWFSGD